METRRKLARRSRKQRRREVSTDFTDFHRFSQIIEGGKRGDLPVCDAVMDTVFSLPMYPELTDEQIRTVTDAVKKAV